MRIDRDLVSGGRMHPRNRFFDLSNQTALVTGAAAGIGQAFAARPGLFGDILAMHVGQLSPMRFAAAAAVLGWQVAIR